MKKIRNSNIELLRIIAMLFIVISHYTVHNGVDNTTIVFGINRIILDISTLGNIGVILFVLISGYFMIQQEKLKPIKIIILWLETFFYSALIYVILSLLNFHNFSIANLIKSMLPITFNQYWFMGVYIMLYILSPFINKFLNSMDRKKHLEFNIILLVLFSLLPTLTTKMNYGNELIQFVLFYSLGAYFYKYKTDIFDKKKNSILLFITAMILILSTIIFDLLGSKINLFNNVSTYFFKRDSFVAITFSISLFNIFINKKEYNNKIINLISSCTLGVYLIHDNIYIRRILWTKILQNANYIYSNYLIIHLLVSVISVFIICTFIELIRKNTIERLMNKILLKKKEKLKKIYKKTICRTIIKVTKNKTVIQKI